MTKTFRTIRISDHLINSCEEFLKGDKAKKLGLETIKYVVEYYVRKGIDNNNK